MHSPKGLALPKPWTPFGNFVLVHSKVLSRCELAYTHQMRQCKLTILDRMDDIGLDTVLDIGKLSIFSQICHGLYLNILS